MNNIQKYIKHDQLYKLVYIYDVYIFKNMLILKNELDKVFIKYHVMLICDELFVKFMKINQGKCININQVIIIISYDAIKTFEYIDTNWLIVGKSLNYNKMMLGLQV